MESFFVVGAGGIGCAVGYELCTAGLPVILVDADPAKIDWGRKHGVRVDDRPPLAATFQTFADWSPAPGATVVLCTKCYDNAAVLDRLPAQTTLLPIQNGFDPALEALGFSCEGIASFISECLPHRTHTRITRPGKLHFGPRLPDCPGTLPQVIDVLRRARLFRVEIVPNILPCKYTKLMYNAAISPLAAAAGLDNGQLLRVAVVRRLFFDLLQENHAILAAAGIELGVIGPFHPDTVQRILRQRWLANALAWVFYPTLRRTYCSMAGDLPRGRTEIDYYNGHLIDLAGDFPCPLNRKVHALVKRLERERIPPQQCWLDELVRPDTRGAVRRPGQEMVCKR